MKRPPLPGDRDYLMLTFIGMVYVIGLAAQVGGTFWLLQSAFHAPIDRTVGIAVALVCAFNAGQRRHNPRKG